jgi:putative membrane protein
MKEMSTWLSVAILGHEGEPLAPHDLWSAWTWEPLVVAGLAFAALVYVAGLYRLWRRAGIGHGVRVWQAGAFGLSLLAFVIALVSPLDALSGALFSAHMTQHMVLMLLAAPLLALSAIPTVALWALPRGWAHAVGRWWGRSAVVRPIWRAASQPIAAWVIAAVTLWVWHVPSLYQAALHSEVVHGLEHVSFVLTTVLFWQVLIRPAGLRQAAYGAGVLYLFTSALQAGALGALLTFAGQPWYPEYVASAAAWGLTPLADQQLAGLIMWLPGGVLYTVVAALLFVVWLEAMDRADRRERGEGEVREHAA